MKFPILAQAVLAALALAPLVSFADETFLGNVIVKQDLVVDQKIEVGEAIVGASVLPGYSLQANSADGSTFIDQIAYGTVSLWNWSVSDGAVSKRIMLLEDSGKLSLYSPINATTPIIVMNAGGATPEITIAGKKIVTEGNIGSILTSQDDASKRMAIGSGAQSLGYGGTAYGPDTIAGGNYSTAIGGGAHAMGNVSLSIGVDSQATGEHSVVVGFTSGAPGKKASVLGAFAHAGGELSTALGSTSVATGDYSSAVGASALASGYASLAMGKWASAIGNNSSAIGYSAEARDANSTAVGFAAHAMGFDSTALGYWAVAYGSHSTALGSCSSTDADRALSLGLGINVTQPYQVAIGSFNKVIDDASFMIGNGTGQWADGYWASENRSNLFVIMKDGRGIFRSTTYAASATPTAVQAKEALTVQGAATIDGAATITGDATVKGALRVRPAGDLPMGPFTAGAQP